MRDDMRRKAMLGSVDRMMSTLDDVDEERLRSRGRSESIPDGEAEGVDRPQLPEEDSNAMDLGGVKGSDSDIDTETLWQKKTAPHDQDQEPERGADTGDEGSGDEDDYRELRDAAAQGDSNARRILEVIDATGDAWGDDSAGDADDDKAALDKSDSDANVTVQTDTTERDGGSGWERKEPVQDGSGQYDEVKAKRRQSQSSGRGR